MNEQDKKLEGIKGRCEAGRTMSHNIRRCDQEFIQWLYEDIAASLDIIARQDVEIKTYIKRGDEWRTIAAEFQADRDRLAAECKVKDARIEALERAIVEKQPCYACLLKSACRPSDKLSCDNRGWNLFKFDEARFSKGGGVG